MSSQSGKLRWVAKDRVVGLLLFLLVGFPDAVAWGAAVRYVETTGKDTGNYSCTKAAPCRTIQRAVDIADPGDAISIGKGKFVESFGVSIPKNLTLNGAGIFSTRVGGTWTGFSVFRVEWLTTVTISGLDVMFGNADYGGGISNYGDLTLQGVRLRKNHAGTGGGIFNWSGATLHMYKSEIANNTASDLGGGIHNQGFAVLDEVLIAANHSDLGAGGISNSGNDGDVSLFVTRSLISHNNGDGIVNWGGMALGNTTVSRNSQVGVYTGAGGYTKLTHVTVADNGKGPGQFPNVSRGGLLGQPGSAIEFFNSIVANNAEAQCLVPYVSVSALGSLVSDGTCNLWPGGGNLVGIDPKLWPLKWSKLGSTLVRTTHALKYDSPAIDAALPEYCQPDDQRGVSRPIDGNVDGAADCDIGAFEYSPLKRWLFEFDQSRAQ